ncbi:glycosyltransferase [Stenotrophomonas cyclobalanopsidis]|uniref:glycosyltransferase n=1 Tax=Stenotrophomonas cyclobalanopsidis TaxID=2771362 RepID=UPI0028A9C9C9|nr:glycosyltransferase [Stenotrophomonas cyclobalanopsidis]
MHITQCLGGVETYLRSFHSHGAFSQFDRRILVTPEESVLSDEWRSAGGEVVVLKMGRSINPWSDALVLFALIKLIRSTKPDVLHLHSSKAGALGRIAALACRRSVKAQRVFYTPHAYFYLGLSGIKRAAFLWVERFLARFADVLMATSDSEASRSVTEVGYQRDSVCVVSNGVELRTGRRVMPADVETREIIFVGRICFQKNVEMLAKVIGHFTAEDRVRFKVVGVGHYQSDSELLDGLFDEFHVDRSIVQVIPWLPREAVLAAFDNSDLCIVTSRYESFGYVAAEAAAAGLPVVATNVDGLRDIVRDGETGFLIPMSDTARFVNCIRVLLGDAELAERMGAKGRQRVSEFFSVERNARLMSSMYSGA